MVRFSIWPTSRSQSWLLDDWRRDRDVLESFGTCSQIWPSHARDARVFFKSVIVGDLLLCGTAVSSGVVYDTRPLASRDPSQRTFYLMMPSAPRCVNNGSTRFAHRAGECMLGDSSTRSVAAYDRAHSGLCLGIPFETLRRYVPNPERFVDVSLGRDGLAKMVPRLLLSIWTAAESGAIDDDARGAAEALLEVLARCCTRGAAAPRREHRSKGVSCDQVKKRIETDLRDPKLTVRSVAKMVGVTTRYLQLLFASEDDCVSQYIKRERLQGCLLDLRDADFDHRSITEIAFSWGFNSATHFSSSFRKEYGLSPRDYRFCDREELATLERADVRNPMLRATLLVNRLS